MRERCKQAGIPLKQKKDPTRDRRFKDLIDDLGATQIIPADERSAWDAVRNLRNSASHPSRQNILPPGLVLAGIGTTARQINQLFATNRSYFSRLGLRVRKATGLHSPGQLPVVAGIDVGASVKGFHLVALHGAAIVGTYHTTEPHEAVRWCKEVGAKLVAVDAPSGWRRGADQSCREAEEILRQLGYSCYPTPCREVADTNPAYAWMINGDRLYNALRAHYSLFAGEALIESVCFETYPYVASCALTGRRLKAEDKGSDGRELIRAAGIDDGPLQSIEHVDATICALVAFSVAIDYCEICGNREEGFIVVPPLH